MNRFIKNLISFFGFGLIFSVILLLAYSFKYNVSIHDMPPPHLTNSFSLDEKIEFLRRKIKKADILSIGSSITLNNIHSETVIERFHSNEYLNTASWGTNMKDNYTILKMLCDVYSPHTIIMASNISEFQLPPKDMDCSVLKAYLQTDDLSSKLYHLTRFDLQYYVGKIRDAKMVRTSKHDYKYLGFDDYGGVKFEGENFNIDHKKWNADFEPGKVIDDNYLYLDSLSTFCKSKNIKLLLFQSPFRKGLYSVFDKRKSMDLSMHIHKIDSILKKGNHIFIDSNNIPWDDVLFVDGTHFNTKGARLFTSYCLDQVEATKQNKDNRKIVKVSY